MQPRTRAIYSEDSFFTLSGAGQVGLLGLSVLLALMLLWLTHRLARGIPRVLVRLVLAMVLFALFVWLSPQVYYAYYQMIIPGLPAQIVIKAPPAPLELIKLLSFTGPATLSAHGQGALGLVLGVVAVRTGRRARGQL